MGIKNVISFGIKIFSLQFHLKQFFEARLIVMTAIKISFHDKLRR